MAGYIEKATGTVRIQYTDWRGVRRTLTPPDTTLKQAKFLYAQLQAEHDMIRKGLKPPPKTGSRKSFAEIAEQYMAWGRAQGGWHGKPWSPIHAGNRKRFLDFWQERLNPQHLADLEGCLPRVENVLRELQRTKCRKGIGRTGKTLTAYADGLAAFCRWAVERGFLIESPLKGLRPFDKKPKSKRRALAPDEIPKLLLNCKPERRLLYEVAMCSGLRANELRSLRKRHLDAARGGLILEDDWTKDREDEFQFLPTALMKRLVEIAKGKKDNEPLLQISKSHLAENLQRELEAIGIPVKTFTGKLDFHALRTTYDSLLFESGASVKEAMSLARHKNPTLTLVTYGRARNERLKKVANTLGEIVLGSSDIGGQAKQA
jgi:integrase